MRVDDAKRQATERALADRLRHVRLGEPVSVRNLCVVPLLHSTSRDPDYLTLDDALAQGTVLITEVSEGGSVPELKVTNTGSQPVLLLDGEELVGAKQNRVLNLTILVKAQTAMVIPVSCVEAGRWAARTERFASSPRAHFAAGRAERMEQVSESLRSDGQRRSDQRQVWEHISMRMADLGAFSPTSAMSDIYGQRAHALEEMKSGLRVEEDQVGAVFLVGNTLMGYELFDHPATMARLFGKLVNSYGLDALAMPSDSVPVNPVEAASALLSDAASAQAEAFEALGAGVDVRLTGDHLTGGALVVEERVVHMSVFRQRPPRETAEECVERPSEGLSRAPRRSVGE